MQNLSATDHTKIQQVKVLPTPLEIARKILAGFDRHYSLFRFSAQRAKTLYESHDWHAIQYLSKERIEYYDTRVRETTYQIAQLLEKTHGLKLEKFEDLTPEQAEYWQAIKREFVGLLSDHLQPELAESFFNSVTTRILHNNYYHNDFLFVRPAVATDYMDYESQAYRVYYPQQNGPVNCLKQLVNDFKLELPFTNLHSDARKIVQRAVRSLQQLIPGTHVFRITPDCQVHVLNSLFYRNKGAYIVGRLVNNNMIYPFSIPILHTKSNELQLDALLFTRDEISTLFSFTRAYFLVDMPVPSAYVDFLSTLMPNKAKAELYTSLGLHKQGKTLFYRDFLRHLKNSTDKFDITPGIKGMVMAVFDLPSFPYVFKLIRDNIRKDGMTHDIVKKKYHMVKMHDRIGRMADTWEYSQVALPKNRCTPALLKELRQEVPSLLTETPDTIIIKHAYIERRMTPLNLYLLNAHDAALEQAVIGYGDAITELAQANIFPGDMLYKNFGVTRLGRVVFYDYDEIQPMGEMNFRPIPPAPNEEAELSGEPWYPIHVNDVFPEEFDSFLLGDARIRQVFIKHHIHLLNYKWWQSCQQSINTGRLEDIFPYPSSSRINLDSINTSLKEEQDV